MVTPPQRSTFGGCGDVGTKVWTRFKINRWARASVIVWLSHRKAMSHSGPYKLDDGTSFATNCFPIRKSYQQRNKGLGQWLVSHRSMKQPKFQVVICAKPLRRWYLEPEPEINVPLLVTREAVPIVENILDKKFLMELFCVDNQSDLCIVDICDKRLVRAKEKDFKLFDNVVYINATENYLQLEVFRTFPIIRELTLQLNMLKRLNVIQGDYPYLEVLDLAYNQLHMCDILQLGLLPRLRNLSLAANGLETLPRNLAAEYYTGWKMVPRFLNLETLVLEDNKFSNSCVFFSLAHLKSLKYLNLDGNQLSEVPYLHETSLCPLNPCLVCKMPCGTQQKILCEKELPLCGIRLRETESTSLLTDSESRSILKSDEDIFDMEFSPAEVPESLPFIKSEISRNEWTGFCEPKCVERVKPGEFVLPFAQLQHLSISHNKVKHEADLLALGLFPTLQKLTLYHNPVVELTEGKLELLHSFLQENLSIQILIHEPSPLLKQTLSHIRKVDTRILKVVKPGRRGQPHSEEATHSLRLGNNTGQSSEARPLRSNRMPKPQSKKLELEVKPELNPFFLTQVDDDNMSSSESFNPAESSRSVSVSETIIPLKYRGYEDLLCSKTDPDFVQPKGIQQSVYQLERTLRKLQLYPDAHASVDLLQVPYIPKESKLRKLPAIQPRNGRVRRLEGLLRKIRERSSMTEIPLARALWQEAQRQEYGDAVMLLKQLQKKYRVAHLQLQENIAALQAECEATASEASLLVPLHLSSSTGIAQYFDMDHSNSPPEKQRTE